jgi:hypothetical protein
MAGASRPQPHRGGTCARRAFAAAPLVAGVASQYLQHHPNATAEEVRRGLLEMASQNAVTGAGTSPPTSLFTSLTQAGSQASSQLQQTGAAEGGGLDTGAIVGIAIGAAIGKLGHFITLIITVIWAMVGIAVGAAVGKLGRRGPATSAPCGAAMHNPWVGPSSVSMQPASPDVYRLLRMRCACAVRAMCSRCACAAHAQGAEQLPAGAWRGITRVDC